MRKKVLTLVLAFVMLLGPVIPASASEVPEVYGDVADIIAEYDGDDIVTTDVLDELYALIGDAYEADGKTVSGGAAESETEPEQVNAATDLAADFSTAGAGPEELNVPSGDAVVIDAAGSGSGGNEPINAEKLVDPANPINPENLPVSEEPGEEETPAPVPAAATQQENVLFVLRFAGMNDSQLSAVSQEENSEQFAYDCEQLAESINLFKGIEYNPTEACTFAQLTAMLSNVQPLYDALHADKLQPLFINGMAQPIFPYTSGMVESDDDHNLTGTYNNADSDIIRFFVYVETNYDTDGDGALDLVKTLVQLPRAAMEGDYKAASIFEARPYITGCTDGRTPNVEGASYDIEKMYSQPDARMPEGETTTAEHAQDADINEWYYWNPYERMFDYEDLDWYDYYLSRGFAVVESGGLGTHGSDGFETCGTDLEIDAFKCVIEWLHGDRVAYTDKTNNITIDADWSNGKVGMTGRSYAGTTQFGLATTGVAGLETIVPVAGIASWYEYTNSQGTATGGVSYSDYLAYYCNGRLLDEDYETAIKEKYEAYLTQISSDQTALNGDYANAELGLNHWQIRDYTAAPLMDNWTGIHIPALIVHGLNDTNVRTKQFDLMYKSFDKAGQNVKLLLHQGTHLTPTYPGGRYEIKIDGEYYDTILNKWFSHYLYGVNNGIERMANVTVQSNVDGSWDTYSSWKTASKQIFNASDVAESATSQIIGAVTTGSGWRPTIVEPAVNGSYTFEIPEDVIIQGAVAVHIRAAATATGETPLSDMDRVTMTVELTDKNDESFDAFVPSRSYLPITTLKEKGAWMGGGVANYDLVEYAQTPATSKSIGLGYIDVFNPTAGYDSASASVRTELADGQYYDYTVYIQPTVYTLKAGHTAEVTISLSNNSGVALTVDNSATYVDIPVHSTSSNGGGHSGGSSGGNAADTQPPADNTTGSAVQTGSFRDVNTGNWYYSAVEYVASKGIMTGISASSFGPNLDTTRGMIVTILYRLENQPTGTEAAAFSDVRAGQYYADAIAWANANGIVTGYGNGLFGPNDAITREQMAAILYRYAQYKEYDVSASAELTAFSDAASVSGYAVDAMKWANAAGLINGVTSSKLAPGNSAARAQVASILMRFCENIK